MAPIFSEMSTLQNLEVSSNSEEEWNHYMKVFEKEYTPEEKTTRKAIFMKNKELVEKHDKLFKQGKVSYSIGLNHLSDRTEEELEKMNGYQPLNITDQIHSKRAIRNSISLRDFRRRDIQHYHYSPVPTVPEFVDWRIKNFVTPIENQGSCGACYAFAGIGAMEAFHKKKTGHLIGLSVQNILDCTWDLGNNGCVSGVHHRVLKYAQINGVLAEDKYPYMMNASHNCKWQKENVVATNNGYLIIPKRNEVSLQHAVAHYGPVAIAVGVTSDFHMYEAGVFNPSTCSRPKHSLLVVGYGSDVNHSDYWVCKNSYGKLWGVDGYILIARNKNNVCGLATDAQFPV